MKSRYLLRITGPNPKRFLLYLRKIGINLIQMEEEEHSYKIMVTEEDYLKIKELPTIYEIHVLKVTGPRYLIQTFFQKKIFFLCLVFAFFLLWVLSHVIFEVEVVHEKKEIRDLLYEELRNAGIERLHPVKSFEQKEKIRSDILLRHKDTLEWIEIDRIGTKYVVRVEERRKKQEEEAYQIQDIIAKKEGIITHIESKTGEILVHKNQYVKKGDILITGVIKNKEEVKSYVKAEGKVLAETWYKATVRLPYHYHEEQETGRQKHLFQIKFLGNTISLFDFSPYQAKRVEEHPIIIDSLLDTRFSYNLEKELKVIDETYTKEDAMKRAEELAKEKVSTMLGVNGDVIFTKQLKITEEDSKIIVDVFLKVEEDITEAREIIIPEDTEPRQE